MGMFKRFWTVTKSYLNHWIGKAEDPEKMLNQMLLEMQEQLITAKKQVAVSIADEKRLLIQYNKEKEFVDEWERKAMLAIKAGKDDLAKQALERKTEHSKMAKGFEEQWKIQKTAVESLKVALSGLSTKIQEAKRKKNLLVSRAKRAEAQQTISATMSGLSSNSASETLERMEERIDQMEAEAEATSELANEIVSDELSAKFDSLEVSHADDDLAALKAKMGINVPETVSQEAESELKAIEKEIEAEVSAKGS